MVIPCLAQRRPNERAMMPRKISRVPPHSEKEGALDDVNATVAMHSTVVEESDNGRRKMTSSTAALSSQGHESATGINNDLLGRNSAVHGQCRPSHEGRVGGGKK
jgi:hypothetical protein